MDQLHDVQKLLENLVMLFCITAALGIFLLFMYSILIQSFGWSTRPRIAEDRFDLDTLSEKRLQKLAAWNPPGRTGSWNRLVREHDGNRLRAMMHRRKHQRRIMRWAWILNVVLFAELVAIVGAQSEIISLEHEIRIVSIASAAGWVTIAVLAWMFPPGLFEWLDRTWDHRFSPEVWRVLHASSFVRDPALETPAVRQNREAPVDGYVTVAVAEGALQRIEAELLLTYAEPKRDLAASVVRWETSTRHRLSSVLAAKAELLDAPNDEVAVARIYAWLDRVASVLLARTDAAPVVREREATPVQMTWSMRRRVLGILNLSFWGSSLFPAVFFLSVPVLVLIGARLAPLFTYFPWMGVVATALVPVVASAVLTVGGQFVLRRLLPA